MSHERAHAARIEDGIVREVIVIPRQEEDRDDLVTAFCNSIGIQGTWIDTSFTGKRRGCYAGAGYTYDSKIDAFIAPSVEVPESSLILEPVHDPTLDEFVSPVVEP
jgi:hypothetical protein